MGRKVQLVENKTSKTFEIVFDEDGVLDTVQRLSDGKFLSTKDSVCKKVLTHADRIRAGFIPDGFSKVGR